MLKFNRSDLPRQDFTEKDTWNTPQDITAIEKTNVYGLYSPHGHTLDYPQIWREAIEHLQPVLGKILLWKNLKFPILAFKHPFSLTEYVKNTT